MPRGLEQLLNDTAVVRYAATRVESNDHILLAYDSHFSMIADLYNCLSHQDVLVSWNLRTDLVTLLRNCRRYEWTEYKRTMDPIGCDYQKECFDCVSDLHFIQEIPSLGRCDVPNSYATRASSLTEERLQQLLDTKGWKELGVVWPPGPVGGLLNDF